MTLPWRLVTVDIDGTLTVGHGWRPIAEAFDRVPEFEAANRRFARHEVGEDEHLENLLNLARGRTPAEVVEVIGRSPRLAGIGEGVAELRGAGLRTALLSHNPTFVVDWYRRRFGFDDGEGVRVPLDRSGHLADATGVRADKPGELVHLLTRTGLAAADTVHVGDGWADARVFPLVGGGIAVNTKLREVAEAADRSLHVSDFREVARAVLELPRRG